MGPVPVPRSCAAHGCAARRAPVAHGGGGVLIGERFLAREAIRHTNKGGVYRVVDTRSGAEGRRARHARTSTPMRRGGRARPCERILRDPPAPLGGTAAAEPVRSRTGTCSWPRRRFRGCRCSSGCLTGSALRGWRHALPRGPGDGRPAGGADGDRPPRRGRPSATSTRPTSWSGRTGSFG
ncbi:hypothetical protein HBB16_05170 [Pseudonocardia sp. MCCB 268]|nr:hypothetical protein [Pseudonocardia cytotoxica]